MRAFFVSVVSGFALFAAFPPFGEAFLAPLGLAGLLWLLRTAGSPRTAVGRAAVFGLTFFGFLFPWLSELGLIAFIPLWLVQTAYLAVYGWGMSRANELSPMRWWAVATGGWGLMELARGAFPLGGFEWGFAGYPMGEYALTRDATQFIGTTGWSVVVVAVAGGLALLVTERDIRPFAIAGSVAAVLMVAGFVLPARSDGEVVRVALVQGSTPCPGTHCANERRQTYETHLALTDTLTDGSVDLVVWPEGSSGGFNADPILQPEVRDEMADQARRLGAVLMAGGDRPLSDTEWVNANVVFDSDGTIIGEYRKRHPVPFGEYIPARPAFAWIRALDAVPRDMIPGDGPLVFEVDFGTLGSVISWEGSFSRFARDEVREGAELLVVATNQGSYPYSYASDQLIGMTRMRSAELGTDVLHVGVVGRSTIITDSGVVGERSGLATSEVIIGEAQTRTDGLTLYARWGAWMQYLAIAGALFVAVSSRSVFSRSLRQG